MVGFGLRAQLYWASGSIITGFGLRARLQWAPGFGLDYDGFQTSGSRFDSTSTNVSSRNTSSICTSTLCVIGVQDMSLIKCVQSTHSTEHDCNNECTLYYMNGCMVCRKNYHEDNLLALNFDLLHSSYIN